MLVGKVLLPGRVLGGFAFTGRNGQ